MYISSVDLWLLVPMQNIHNRNLYSLINLHSCRQTWRSCRSCWASQRLLPIAVSCSCDTERQTTMLMAEFRGDLSRFLLIRGTSKLVILASGWQQRSNTWIVSSCHRGGERVRRWQKSRSMHPVYPQPKCTPASARLSSQCGKGRIGRTCAEQMVGLMQIGGRTGRPTRTDSYSKRTAIHHSAT